MKPTAFKLKHHHCKYGRRIYYQYYVHGQLVSSCYIEEFTMDNGHRCGRIYAVCTPELYRRQGYAYAMLYRILHSYHWRGATITLSSTPMATRLYESLGFRCKQALYREYELKL